MCKRVKQSPCDKTVASFLPLAPLNCILNACLNDGICKTMFSQEQTNKIMLGSRAVQCFLFHSWNAGELSMAFIKKTPKDTREQSYLCVSVLTFRCSGELWCNEVRYWSGEQTIFLGKAGRIHKEALQPLGIPWLSPSPFETSNPTSASLRRGTIHTCACVHHLNVPLRSQDLYERRQDLLRDHPMLPQKGDWFTSSPSLVPTRGPEMSNHQGYRTCKIFVLEGKQSCPAEL